MREYNASIRSETSYVEWAQHIGSQQSGVVFILVLHSNTKKEEKGPSTVSYHLNVYSVTASHDHPAERRKRKREEAAASGEKVTIVKDAPEEQKLSWRAAHPISGPDSGQEILTCAFAPSLSLGLVCALLHTFRSHRLILLSSLREQRTSSSAEVSFNARASERGTRKCVHCAVRHPDPRTETGIFLSQMPSGVAYSREATSPHY